MIQYISVPRSGGATPSMVAIGDTLGLLPDLLRDRRPIVITDVNVYRLYKSWIDLYPHVVMGTGEQNKTLEVVQGIYRSLLDIGADRGSYLVGIGGGIVTDVTGFVASTYMRGVAGFGFVASTLLAQVDASVGGKNGVNLDGYKNIIGTFNQPDFVLCDRSLLDTLPSRELRAGLAEVIKCGMIRDGAILDLIDGAASGELTSEELHRAVVASVELKAAVVTADEREHGERKLLNLGHTLAHAVEKCSSEFLHGEAVAIGLVASARISHNLGLLSADDMARVESLVSKVGLPTELPSNITVEQLITATLSDKKREAQHIDYIVMEGLGRAAIRRFGVGDFGELVRGI